MVRMRMAKEASEEPEGSHLDGVRWVADEFAVLDEVRQQCDWALLLERLRGSLRPLRWSYGRCQRARRWQVGGISMHDQVRQASFTHCVWA